MALREFSPLVRKFAIREVSCFDQLDIYRISVWFEKSWLSLFLRTIRTNRTNASNHQVFV